MEFWTLPEAVRRCGLGRRTLERAISTGDLPAYKVGTRTLVKPAEITAWITARPVRTEHNGGAA